MFDVFESRLEILGSLRTITALRIGQGRAVKPTGSDLPVMKDALGRPLIPGASFKGALRSRLESFLRGIHPDLAHDPSELTNADWMREIRRLKDNTKNDDVLTQEILKKTDLISKVFGAPWLSSKFQVRDLTVDPNGWFDQYQERDGVAIDRDTETASNSRLYDFQVVPAGVSFEFHSVVENAQDWELGLLMIGLHQFETEQIPLGGGCSRGLGVVRLEIESIHWFSHNGDTNRLLNYMQQLGSHDEELSSQVDQDQKQAWVQALIYYLSQTDLDQLITTPTGGS